MVLQKSNMQGIWFYKYLCRVLQHALSPAQLGGMAQQPRGQQRGEIQYVGCIAANFPGKPLNHGRHARLPGIRAAAAA